MNSKFFQGIVNKVGEVIDCEFGILDSAGRVLATNIAGNQDKIFEIPLKDFRENCDVIENKGYLYKATYQKNKIDLIAYIKNQNQNKNINLLNFFAIHINSMKLYYDEKYDKYSFVKNMLLENLLPADIPIKARELGISNSVNRLVVFLKCKKENKDNILYNELKDIFSDSCIDFIVLLEDQGVAVIKEIKNEASHNDIVKITDIIIERISKEVLSGIKIGVGSIIADVKDVGKSFKEAHMAAVVGEIFRNEEIVTNYNSLGLGRLIYHMPKTLCKLFLNEVFEEDFFDTLDEETLFTVIRFFENNLNVSETSRKLFVHRNTLVYRLDKIQKNTGLNLRMFDDAIIFKVALMVRNYLKNS